MKKIFLIVLLLVFSGCVTTHKQSVFDRAEQAGKLVVDTVETGTGVSTAAEVVAVFNGGTCSGYLKSDGTCDTPAGGGDLLADGSVPLTANWDVGAYTITGTRFISDIATGTAPLGISSTTLVSNLNADLLDGNEASAFMDVNYLDGSSDAAQTISLYDGDSNKVTLDIGDLSGDITVNFPTSAGTLLLTNDPGTSLTGIPLDSDFGSNGVMNRTGAGTYSVLAIGTDIQAYSDYLADISGLTPVANNLLGWNSGGTDIENKSSISVDIVLGTTAVTTDRYLTTDSNDNLAIGVDGSSINYFYTTKNVAAGLGDSDLHTLSEALINDSFQPLNSNLTDLTDLATATMQIGALTGVDSIDATGAVDMDYGSADVTDHTFTSDGGTTIIDGSTIRAAGAASPYMALQDSDAAGADYTDEETVKIYGQQTTTTEDGEVGDFRIASVGGSAAGTWNTNIWFDSSDEAFYLGTMTDADAPAAIAGSERIKIDFNTDNDNEAAVTSDSGVTQIEMGSIIFTGTGMEHLLSTTTVSFAADGDTTLFTVPTGKRCVLTKAIVVAAADAASTDVTIGQNGAETDFLGTQQMDNLDAQYDAIILMPIPNATPVQIKSYAAATVIEMNVANNAGAAGNTVYLYGILY